jgi:hypothetical protein
VKQAGQQDQDNIGQGQRKLLAGEMVVDPFLLNKKSNPKIQK